MNMKAFLRRIIRQLFTPRPPCLLDTLDLEFSLVLDYNKILEKAHAIAQCRAETKGWTNVIVRPVTPSFRGEGVQYNFEIWGTKKQSLLRLKSKNG